MRVLLLCILLAACADVVTDASDDGVAVEGDCAEANNVCEREAPESVDYETTAFTCSPCPPFQLGRNLCCVAVHACCRS